MNPVMKTFCHIDTRKALLLSILQAAPDQDTLSGKSLLKRTLPLMTVRKTLRCISAFIDKL